MTKLKHKSNRPCAVNTTGVKVKPTTLIVWFDPRQGQKISRREWRLVNSFFLLLSLRKLFCSTLLRFPLRFAKKKKNLIVMTASQNGSGDDVHNSNGTPRRRIDLREYLDVYFPSVLLPSHHWGLHFQEICLIANCI